MNTIHPVADKIVASLRGSGRGYVFNSADFSELASRSALDKALSRLALQGVIRRLAYGLYHFPRINPKLGGVLNPLADAVAQAVARKTDSRVIPSGAMAANVLGFSTQVPAKAIYLTDGPSRHIRYGSQTIIFKHAAPRTMAVSGRTSAVIFQALRYAGHEGVTDTMVRKLGRELSARDKQVLKRDMRHAVAWMRPFLSRIIGEAEKK